MKQLIFVFILLTSCLACANNQAGQAERKKDMENERKAKNYETDIEEVNVYIADCGITRKACVTDCIGGSAWISTMN